MEDKLVFNHDYNLIKYAFREVQTLFWTFISFLLIDIVFLIAYFIFLHPALLIFVFGFPLMSLMVLAAILGDYYFGRATIVLYPKNLTIPQFKYGNYKLLEINNEGYSFDSMGNIPVLNSSYKNISEVWKVADEKEKQNFKINKGLYYTKVYVEMAGIQLDIKNINSIMKNYEKNKAFYEELIKLGFLQYYAINPDKVVGIKFKTLPFQVPNFVPDSLKNSEWYKFMVGKFYPKEFRNLIVYVSVEDPDKLIAEINSRK